MEVAHGQGQVFSERAITIDDTQRAAMGAVSRHVMLAIETIGVTARSVDFANNTLAKQVRGRACTTVFMHRFDDANEFMSRDALEGQVAACDLQVGIADTSLENADEGFSWLEIGSPVVLLKG